MIQKDKNNNIQDPLAEERLKAAKEAGLKGLIGNKKYRKDRIVRIEELKKRLEEGGEYDPQDVISMYMPRGRLRRFGAALLRLNRWYLLLLGLFLALLIIFILAISQEELGDFTINLNRLDLYRKGISISETGDFEISGAKLNASPMENATNMSIHEIPEDVDEIEGSHNGKNYMAYTFYVRNNGREDIAYIAQVNIETATKGADKALRVAVWKNNVKSVYAAPAADGGTEDGCKNFFSSTIACVYPEDDFKVGNVDKYTVVVWLEGDDPECVDDIIGGNVRLNMSIDTEDDEDDDGSFKKLAKELKNILAGNGSISDSSQTNIPQYYLDNEVTWANRRNK